LLRKPILRTLSLNMNNLKKASVKNSKTTNVLFALGFLLFIGCSKCEECDLSGSVETICETEFDSPEEYQDAIADREIAGANCSSTGGI